MKKITLFWRNFGLVFFIFCFTTGWVQAQETSHKYPPVKLHLFPLTGLEPDGGIRFGLELPVLKKVSLHLDYNHLLDVLQKDAARENFSGQAFRLEPRVYFGENAHSQYIALQGLYKHKSWDFKDGEKDLRQRIYVVSFKYGRVKYFGSRAGMDYYVGAGGGIKNNEKAFGEGFLRNREGTSLRPNILLGASFFLRLS